MSTGESLGPFGGSGGGVDIVGGQGTPQQSAEHKKLQQTQARVDEVVDLMRTNVDNLLERDVKLADLDYTAEGLKDGASRFEQQAGKLKKKFWLHNLKVILGLAAIILVIVIIIIVSFMPENSVVPTPTTLPTVPPTTTQHESLTTATNAVTGAQAQ